jgi:xanthine/uracil permease
MTAPPSRWRDSAMNLAMTVLMIAVMLYVAARLIVAVLPVLIAVGVAIVLGFGGWSLYQFHKSRW